VEELTSSESQTEEFGRKLAAGIGRGAVVYLRGELGAGKTCLVRGVAEGLGARTRQVASPTFAILHEYAGASGGIVLAHLDLYRLKDEEKELEVLGLPESVAGAPVIVEWPGQAIGALLPPTIDVSIEVLSDTTRRIRVERIEEKSPAPGDARVG
jgi:tRNA threonylcarbamoyl adenosine modification protein YjeE